MDNDSRRTTVSTPPKSDGTERQNGTRAPRPTAARPKVASRLRSGLSSAADLIGLGNRRSGMAALAVLGVGAVLLPIVLLIVFASADGSITSAVLGLMLGVIVDLLAALLLIAVISHKMTSRRQGALTRKQSELLTRTTNLAATVGGLEVAVGEIGSQTSTLQTVLGEQGETLKRQTAAIAATRTALGNAVTEVGNRLQATQNLFALVTPRGPLPPMVGYVAAPDVLVVLVHKFLSLRPSLAIECGSGTSTLFLALAAQQYGINCRLVSLEHDLGYAESTRALVEDHGVAHLVDIRHAPLRPTSLTDHAGEWYDPAAYADLHDIGLVFVDGPPGDVGPQARYPMVPLLAHRLGNPCAILLDDMRRPDERAVAERWIPQLEGFRYRSLPLARGAGLFTRGC